MCSNFTMHAFKYKSCYASEVSATMHITEGWKAPWQPFISVILVL
jgi:hypothetical protein